MDHSLKRCLKVVGKSTCAEVNTAVCHIKLLKKMLLVWGLLLVCATASGSSGTMLLNDGENLTIKCSTAHCLEGLGKLGGTYVGMRLYLDHEKLAYFDYDSKKGGLGNFVPTPQYTQRLQKNGPFEKLNITIINVTVHDSGFYRCLVSYWVKQFKFLSSTSCNEYRVIVKPADTTEMPTRAPEKMSTRGPVNPSCEIPFMLIIITATVSIIFTMIFTLCFIPKIKQWSRSSESRYTHSRPSDVYEVMTGHGFRPANQQ